MHSCQSFNVGGSNQDSYEEVVMSAERDPHSEEVQPEQSEEDVEAHGIEVEDDTESAFVDIVIS
jgi:hypothetical protein